MERAADLARTCEVAFLPVVLDTLAIVEWRTGRWPQAWSRSISALREARELGQTWQVASCLTTLARIAAGRGGDEECRALATEALDLLPYDHFISEYALSAVGLLELGVGRLDAAAETFEGIRRVVEEYGIVASWLPVLVEMHVRRRRHDDARAALVRLEQHAVAANRPSLQAAAARSRGLLAPPHAFRQHFEEALRLHAQMPTPFERARTELCFGERLRRTRRRAEARTHLVSALATFERLGAAPWVERARRELGSKARPSDVGADIEETLTPHERQVASLVVQGATNGEAARTLFVTPKAVEYHLSNIYRKLDIRSRTQLTRLFLERR